MTPKGAAFHHPDVSTVLRSLDSEIARVLGPRLTGLYLVGSLVTGDFDLGVSDIDLIAIVTEAIPADELTALRQMHDGIAGSHPAWNDRIEVIYVTQSALRTFRTRRYTLAVISPGEAFHSLDAGMDWLINWYMLRTRGMTIRGPSPATLVEEFTDDDLVEAASDIALNLSGWIRGATRRNQGIYAVLTACRALHSVTTRGFTSKAKAATWAITAVPDHAPAVSHALRIWQTDWHNIEADRAGVPNGAAEFIDDVARRIELASRSGG